MQLCVHECSSLTVFLKNNLFYLHWSEGKDPIIDSCELPCGCWELNSGPLEKQPVFLSTEPSLQSPSLTFILKNNYTYTHQLKRANSSNHEKEVVRWAGGYSTAVFLKMEAYSGCFSCCLLFVVDVNIGH